MIVATKDNFIEVTRQLMADRVILNRAEIMRKTGCAKSYVTTLLNGHQPPGAKFLKKFNDAFLSDKAIQPEVVQLRRKVAEQTAIILAQQDTIEAQKELIATYRQRGAMKVS